MSPTCAIQNLDQIKRVLDAKLAEVYAECDRLEKQWNGLRSAGGQREESAIQLLSFLRRPINSLALMCDKMCDQIESMDETGESNPG